MGQLVVMPDAELVVVTYLNAVVPDRPEDYATGARFGTRLPPAADPGRYGRVRGIGGAATGLVVDRPQLDVQIWDPDDRARMQLALLAQALLHAMAGTVQSGVTIYRVSDVARPVQVPDPADDGRTVCLLTVEVGMRGAVRT